MDLQQIETFISLMETRSFNRTAEVLDITQSTVSHRVRALETALGRRLFTRSRAGTLPTVAGTRFLEHALRLRQQWREARRQVETAEAFDRMMQIGLQHDIAAVLTGPVMQRVRDMLPTTAFYLEVDYSIQMVADLLGGGLDLALVFTPRYTPDLHVEEIGTLQYRMVSTEPMPLEAVTPQTYILPEISPVFTRLHAEALPHLGTSPLACGQSGAICDLLTALGGTSYLSQPVADQNIRAGRLHAVENGPVIDQPVYAVLSLRHRHQRSHARVLQAVREIAEAGLGLT